MILYICGNKKNAHDMDFLNDFDKVDCKIASEFSVRRFLDEANTYVNLEYLILDIMVVHDTQEELICIHFVAPRRLFICRAQMIKTYRVPWQR